MLSKLLSNIGGMNITSGEEVIGSNKEGGKHSPKEVFESLLLSLQDQSSSGKAKEQLLGLSDSSSEEAELDEEDSSKNILGGSFTPMGDAENLQQVDRSILKELQKEFQNLKTQLEDTSKVSSEDGGKGQDKNEISESSDRRVAEESKVKTGDTNSNSGSEAPTLKGLDDNTAEKPQKKVEEKGEQKNNDPVEKSEKQEDSSKANVRKPVGDNLKRDKSENVESGNKEVVKDIDGAVEHVKGGDGNAPIDNEKIESAASSKRAELEQSFLKTNGSTDKNEGGQLNAVPQDGDDQVITKEVKESGEQSSQKKDIENQEDNIDRQAKSFEKVQGLAGSHQMQPEAIKQNDEGQQVEVKDQNLKAGNVESGEQVERGQTAKMELREQQKKVMDPSIQKNDAFKVSTKGVEMKSTQNEKGKNTKEKNEEENRKQGLGKESSEGRNKQLSRLGISSVNAQKQAKPFDIKNFSGVSVGESKPSLEEQKINWEEQLSKTVDSSADKESKASSVRLGQMPITNGSLRKKILPGLTKRIQQAASSSKESSGNWQKHSFTLDDEKNIQLSVRESKGVLQVKMGSMNLDLSKILQQNIQQIREHLRQEFGAEVDLQFESQQQGEESQFSDNTASSDRKRNYRSNFGVKGVTVETAEDISRKTVRNFGYNQMEWTA